MFGCGPLVEKSRNTEPPVLPMPHGMACGSPLWQSLQPCHTRRPPPRTSGEPKLWCVPYATELRQRGAPSLETANHAWLESQPQSLWPLLDATVAASAARKRDEALLTAGRWLLANQLELIRYKLERGHDWAREMLDAYQEKLIALIRPRPCRSRTGSSWSTCSRWPRCRSAQRCRRR